MLETRRRPIPPERAIEHVPHRADTEAMRVLVIDDDFDARLVCRYALEGEGHEVLESSCGSEGLNVAVAHTPDLILLDVMMPHLDGIEVLRELRQLSETKNVPVIIVSAKITREDKLAGWEAGADEYMTKPFDPIDLILSVDRATNLDAAQRQIARAMARSGLAAGSIFPA
jgi:DNA-binding response OmpR family regulator